MSRRRLVLGLGGGILAAIIVGGLVTLWLGADGASPLGGAEEIAAGRDLVSARDLIADEMDDFTPDAADLDLDLATTLTADTDDGLYVLIEPGEEGTPRRWLVQISSTAAVVAIGAGAGSESGYSRQTAFAVLPDGSMALVTDYRSSGTTLSVVGFDFEGPVRDLDVRFPVGAIDQGPDGTWLVGGSDDARIDLIAEDGTTTALLGPPGSDARVVLDEPLGPIVALVGLSDGRVVFVADTADGFELHVLDGTEVQAVVPDGRSPVLSSGERRDDPSLRADRLAMTPLALAPGGRVLATGVGRGGDPVISVVDVDSGEVEELAVLEGVEVTIERPVSGVAVGDDLVFLADGKLWRLEDAFR